MEISGEIFFVMDPAYIPNTRQYHGKFSRNRDLIITHRRGTTIYLLAVPVNVEEFLQILIERPTKFSLKLHLEAAISGMTSNLCSSFRSSAVGIALCVVTKSLFRCFQKQF